MKKFKKTVFVYLIVFAAGMMMYGIIQCAILAATKRVNASGGEWFLVPLMAMLVYIGWCLCRSYWENIGAEKMREHSFRAGYQHGKAAAAEQLMQGENK